MVEFKQRTIAESIKVLQAAMPRVIISAEAMAKMQLYVETCDTEVGWLGTAIKQDNTYFIIDTYLFDQEVHSTTTEITPEGLSTFGEKILEKENGMEIWNNLKVWGHSHVRMAVSPSGQDDSQMNTFKDGGHDWFIRIIGNKTGDLKIDIYNYEMGIIYNDMKFLVGATKKEIAINEKIAKMEEELRKLKEERIENNKTAIEAEVKEKVKKKTYATTKYQTPYSWMQDANGRWVQTQLEQKKTTGNVTTINATEKGKTFGQYDYTINTESDVYFYIDTRTLEEAATCRSIAEINTVLRDNDYIPTDYDAYEKNLIMEVAQADFKRKCK